MAYSDSKTIVSTKWLAEHINAPDIRILDASWFLPVSQRDPLEEYEECHIPGARFFDIDDVSDSNSELPHMAPPLEKFMSRMRKMGIGDGHRVIVYDSAGIVTAPRVWWMFRLMGQTDVAVLDGGLMKWLRDGYETEDMPPVIRDRHMTARRNALLVKDVTQVALASKLRQAEIVDARSVARFTGAEEEPREGLRRGHIPHSINVYHGDLITREGTMKPVDELKTIFETAGVDLSRPIITTCGSGVTACVLDLALERIGHRDHSVYDGSWSEWGMYNDLNVETGEANV
ncbi:MAG: 3-mercaptopyruvate sulfurtransferase [Rhodobacteraceae bacterium]|nr:3-mercaptopyruvate sulfurtransferase [Paracoccaceae bacterium]